MNEKLKEKYRKLSDFEINVGIVKNYTKYDKYQLENDGSNSVNVYYGSQFYGNFNYCKNPSDGFDLIIENKISLIPFFDEKYLAAYYKNSEPEYEISDNNPLRACMLVLLMIKSYL